MNKVKVNHNGTEIQIEGLDMKISDEIVRITEQRLTPEQIEQLEAEFFMEQMLIEQAEQK